MKSEVPQERDFETNLEEKVERYKRKERFKRYWLIPLFLVAQCQPCCKREHTPTNETETNLEEKVERGKRNEKLKRYWFIPLFRQSCCKWEHTKKFIYRFSKWILIILQLIILLVFTVDILIYRPVLFFHILTNGFNVSQIQNVSETSSTSRLYHEYEDYFLFVWDYVYGLIAFCSTFFLFYYTWLKPDEHVSMPELIRNIIENKGKLYEYKNRVEKSRRDSLLGNEKEKLAFQKLNSSHYRSRIFGKFGWTIVHLIVFVMSFLLVIYWIFVNLYVWMKDINSHSLLKQLKEESDLLFIFMIFDSFYWHLAPVLVCFLVRASCIDLTSKLNRLGYEFANSVQGNSKNGDSLITQNVAIQTMDDPGDNGTRFKLWSRFYLLLKQVETVSSKYCWIAAINSVVLVFGVVGLTVKYIMDDNEKMLDFLEHDTIDAVRLITWYVLHLISVWLMVDSMADLNLNLDEFSDQIFIILAKEEIELTKEMQAELNICSKTKIRFMMNFFGVVTTSTSNLLVAFGGATIAIFLTEGIQIVLNHLK